MVTGSELVRGERADLNGPYLARELIALGFEAARISIVGDQPVELADALRQGLGADLCVISGGLGPTHDDRTVEALADVTGRALDVRPELEAEIGAISRRIADRLGRPWSEFEHGVRKQASLPRDGISLGLAGTAPGIVLPLESTVAVVLPGPPAELQRLWGSALRSDALRPLLVRARPPDRRVLRFYGISESMVARTLAESGGEGAGVEVTVCARELEVHVDLLADSGAGAHADRIAERLRAELAPHLFAEDDRPVEELVLSLCGERGFSLATAESCTGGLVAARLTAVPGASESLLGSIVAYADAVKVGELAVPEDVLRLHGAVSAETARAMTRGVRARLGADVAVSVTGVAGPGGGTSDKPVGLVYLHAETPDTEEAAHFRLPGDRDHVRRRAAAAALHLLRRVLGQRRHTPV